MKSSCSSLCFLLLLSVTPTISTLRFYRTSSSEDIIDEAVNREFREASFDDITEWVSKRPDSSSTEPFELNDYVEESNLPEPWFFPLPDSSTVPVADDYSGWISAGQQVTDESSSNSRLFPRVDDESSSSRVSPGLDSNSVRSFEGRDYGEDFSSMPWEQQDSETLGTAQGPAQGPAPGSRPGLTFSVSSYGAVGDGVSDDTQAFQSAWNAACNGGPGSTIDVPAGSTYRVGEIAFQGPCSSNIIFQVDGDVVAPPCDTVQLSGQWILLKQVSVSVQGTGSFDGNGLSWWTWNSKAWQSAGDKPTLMRFLECNSTSVSGISLRNSPQIHLKFDTCNQVTVQHINIASPADSPNTDGINVAATQNIDLGNLNIGSGDDCIAIEDGSSAVNIHDIQCGPGHGISIGGLGVHNSYADVSNITVHDVNFLGTSNGARIKTWQGGSGTVSGVTFSNIYLSNVGKPVVIDQYYCNGNHNCGNSSQAIQVTDITYSNITGTSANEVALDFACSDSLACTNISLSAIDITYSAGGSTQASCWNAFGSDSGGPMNPPCCLGV